MSIRTIDRTFVAVLVVTMLIIGAVHSTPLIIPTSPPSNLVVPKPTQLQHGNPMDSRITLYEPALFVPVPKKEENEIKEEKCLYCCEIPVVGANGKVKNTFEVHLYNEHKTTFNEQDASLYFADVYRLLRIYYIDGVWCSAVLAQAYTEGGAGKVGVYSRTNNLFGIMASPTWSGYVYARSNQTVYESYEVAKENGGKELFCAYSSINESIRDYLKLIQSNRYKDALLTTSPHNYLKTLLRNGYGTQSMLDVWATVIDIFDLTTYDK